MESTEQEANEIVAAALLRGVEVQAAGYLDQISEIYDDVYGQILPLVDEFPPTLGLAFRFWECWGDTANHDWQFYGFAAEDWPRMAQEIAAALQQGVEVTDPTLVERFAPRRTLRERLGGLLHRPPSN